MPTAGREPTLVLGATGGQGGAVVGALRATGTPTRAMVRRPDSDAARRLARAGVEVVAGDLRDPEALRAAMTGTRAAFAVTTPFEAGPAIEVAQGRAIIEGALAGRLPWLVFSSVAGADARTGVPHFESKAAIESMITNSGLSHAVLAPTYFFDNALGGVDDLLSGRLVMPLPPERALQQLARTDLAAVAVRVLAEPDVWAGRRLELAGDEPTLRAMAETLSEVLERPVALEEASSEQIPSSDMRAMWEFFGRGGYGVDLATLRKEFPDLAWTSFADWARATFSS